MSSKFGFNLENWTKLYYDDERMLRVLTSFFEWVQDKRGQWIALVDRSRVIFDGLVVTDHEDLVLLVRESPEEIVSYKIHPSHCTEYKRLYEIESAYEEEGYYAYGDACEAWSQAQQGRGIVCANCGSKETSKWGDAVYFGYVGPARCPQCNVESERNPQQEELG